MDGVNYVSTYKEKEKRKTLTTDVTARSNAAKMSFIASEECRGNEAKLLLGKIENLHRPFILWWAAKC
jgi:hypothetical protein